MDYYSSNTIELCYVSKASKTINNKDFLRIIKASRAWNEAHQLTSILFYKEGYFCQIIEGSLKNLDLVCRRIKVSSLHYQIMHLETREVVVRSVPQHAFRFYAQGALELKFPELAQEIIGCNCDRVSLIRSMRKAAIQASNCNENREIEFA